jgi:ribonuclease HI
MEWLLHTVGPPQWKLYAENRIQWRQAAPAFLENARHQLDGSSHTRPKKDYRQRAEHKQGERELWKLSDRMAKINQVRVGTVSKLRWPSVRIYGDCRPLTKTMAGIWRSGENKCTGVIRETTAWWSRVFKVPWTGQTPFKDIRRHKNKEADRLANKGADGETGFWVNQSLWFDIYRRAGAKPKGGTRTGDPPFEDPSKTKEGRGEGSIRIFFDGSFRKSAGTSGYGTFAEYFPSGGGKPQKLFEKFGPTDAVQSYEAESQAAGEGVFVLAKMLVDAVGGAMDIMDIRLFPRGA